MKNEDLVKFEAVAAKLDELRKIVEGSLNLRANGGVHIANEIINLQPVLAELKKAIEDDIAAHAGA